LKLPDRDARMELAVAEARGSIAPQLHDLVAGIRLGHPLKRVVELRITRGVQRLPTEDAEVLATVCDGTVHAHTLTGDPVLSDRREIEVELGPAGDEALLAVIGEHLIGAGAVPSAVRSKFEHALGIKTATRATATTAGAVVVGYLAPARDWRGENGFTLDVLHEHEQQRASRAGRLVAADTSALATALD
jgi:hypothetical protein